MIVLCPLLGGSGGGLGGGGGISSIGAMPCGIGGGGAITGSSTSSGGATLLFLLRLKKGNRNEDVTERSKPLAPPEELGRRFSSAIRDSKLKIFREGLDTSYCFRSVLCWSLTHDVRFGCSAACPSSLSVVGGKKQTFDIWPARFGWFSRKCGILGVGTH
mgnify:CR=1 FL=1